MSLAAIAGTGADRAVAEAVRLVRNPFAMRAERRALMESLEFGFWFSLYQRAPDDSYRRAYRAKMEAAKLRMFGYSRMACPTCRPR